MPALGDPQIDLEVAQELLRDGELRLVLDDDGGWLPWAPQGEWPGRELWLKADLRAGDRASSLAIAATDGHPVAPPERREMQGICRRWNEAGAGLRAHLDTRAGSALVFAWIESDVVIPSLIAGCEDFVDAAIRSVLYFFDWLEEQRPGARQTSQAWWTRIGT